MVAGRASLGSSSGRCVTLQDLLMDLIFRPRSWRRSNPVVVVVSTPHPTKNTPVTSAHPYILSSCKGAGSQSVASCLKPNPHRMPDVTCVQIGTFFLWYCLRAVWIPPFTSTGPICWRRVARPVWIGPYNNIYGGKATASFIGASAKLLRCVCLPRAPCTLVFSWNVDHKRTLRPRQKESQWELIFGPNIRY